MDTLKKYLELIQFAVLSFSYFNNNTCWISELTLSAYDPATNVCNLNNPAQNKCFAEKKILFVESNRGHLSSPVAETMAFFYRELK